MRQDYIFEMETGDPDDFLTLLLMLDHPRINLKAVVINPGSPEQVGLVRWALERFDVNIPVGSLDLHNKNKRQKPNVSAWHHEIVAWNPSKDAQEGRLTLIENMSRATILFIGALPRVTGSFLGLAENARYTKETTPKRIVMQGGFAGDSLVSPEARLAKFEGLESSPTFNLNGHKRSSQRLLDWDVPKRFVSKNVCHGMLYDRKFHEGLAENRNRLSLNLIWKFMDKTYIKQDKVKALHDPFALACAIDESCATWEEIQIYRNGSSWGSIKAEGSKTHITIAGDHDKFFDTIVARQSKH
jgi:pyrimidine-specific ribonucleoside hydrolase